MPIISTCPKCKGQVTVPDGIDHEAEVRCPRCAVVYPLREALAELPPALIPVDTENITPASPDSEAAASSGLISEPFHVPPTQPEAKPDEQAESPEAEAEEPGDMGAGLDVWEKVDSAPQIDLGRGDLAAEEADGQEAAAEAFAGFAMEESEQEVPADEGRPAPVPRRKKKKQKSALREMVGAILGGFLGLAIGYYLLNWIGGPRFDFMEFYLPGVPHTYKHWPGADAGKSPQPDDRPGKPAANRSPQGEPSRQEQPLPERPGRSAEDSPPPERGPQPPPREPAARQPPAESEPAPLPPEQVGPVNPLSFTSDELGEALKSAHEAVRDADPTALMSLETYQALCRLGHVLAFVRRDPADGRLVSRQQAVQGILEDLGRAGGQPDEVGRLAGELLQREPRPGNGILLGGRVRGVASKGGLHGLTVKLPDPYPLITVMSDRPLPVGTQDGVLILGSIVEDPAQNVVGYDGTQPLLIWAGTAVSLPQDQD